MNALLPPKCHKPILLSITFLILSLKIKTVSCWGFKLNSYNPYCHIQECCNADWIINDIKGLRRELKERVYGQHLIEVAVDAIEAHLLHEPQKALTLSFHGWPGGGKNYVAHFITQYLYAKGSQSKYVHNFISRIHFPHESKVQQYKEDLFKWLQGNISSCPQQLFIFDEVDKMPAGLLNSIKPIIDYRKSIDRADYTKSIFIFLSNTGAMLINKHYEDLYSSGVKRDKLTLLHFDQLILKGSFNEDGGFHHSDTIKSNLIDHYIPFLPMHEHHVEMCIKDEFRKRGVFLPKTEHIQEVLKYVEWGPDTSKLFSKTGCKRIDTKVGILAYKHYPNIKKDEL